jgi:hypothetical protein
VSWGWTTYERSGPEASEERAKAAQTRTATAAMMKIRANMCSS